MKIRQEQVNVDKHKLQIGDLVSFNDRPEELWFICQEYEGYILRSFQEGEYLGYSGHHETIRDCVSHAETLGGKLIRHYSYLEYELQLIKK